MIAPKPRASLSPGLLARKGEAGPATRAQQNYGLADLADAGEALGWNDMGQSAEPQPAEPQPDAAAFTVRLDPERHRRLQLAAAASGRSAEQLVTAALDAFLTTLPEVEALSAHLPPRPNTDRSKD